MSKNTQLAEDVSMASKVGRLLPETIEKVEHYKAILKAEATLLEKLKSRQKNIFLSNIRKYRESIEIELTTNSIIYKQKIYENYLGRKSKYENWLDEKSLEVQEHFETVLANAKTIQKNVRLVDSIKSFESRSEADGHTVDEKVQFYLYLQQEIDNHQQHSKKKRR
jgi:hypothetical protein